MMLASHSANELLDSSFRQNVGGGTCDGRQWPHRNRAIVDHNQQGMLKVPDMINVALKHVA